MTEILHVAKIYNRSRAFLILGCGHWYKWDSSQQAAPRPGTEFRCPAPGCEGNKPKE